MALIQLAEVTNAFKELSTKGFGHLRYCYTNISGFLTILPSNNSSHTGVTMYGTFYEMMLEWLGQSNYFNQLTLEYLPMVVKTVEDTNTSFGAIHFLESRECDVVVGSILLRQDRYRRMDFIHPFIFDSGNLAIPVPASSTPISAIWKPFQFHVWMVLLLTILAVVAAMSSLDRCSSTRKLFGNNRLSLHWLFVIGTLFSQSGRSTAGNRLTLRFVTGAWCLASLVIITSFSSTLTSFIMASNYKPLVNSIEELVEKLEFVQPVVLKNLGMDVTISNSNDTLMKKLATKINNAPNSRCLTSQQCLDEVKKGSTVFIHTRSTAIGAMEKDFRQTGRCNFALARDSFGLYPSSWGIAKRNPYLETLNRGVLRMMETGLVAKWTKDNQPQLRQCLGRNPEIKQKNDELNNISLQRISLDNMKGAFVILLSGIIISALMCAIEIVFYRFLFIPLLLFYSFASILDGKSMQVY